MTPEQEIRKVLGDWFEAAPIWYEQLTQQLLGVTSKLETELALARQHKGGWRHLDRDAEKPGHLETCLVSDGKKISVYTYNFHDDTFAWLDKWRWWQPLPQPPKD